MLSLEGDLDPQFFPKFTYFNWRIITVLWWILHYEETISISMNWPQVYMCPLHPEPLPHSPPLPSWLSQSTGFGCPAPYFKLTLVICFTYGNIYVSKLFSQIVSPSPPTEPQSLFFTSVSPLPPHTWVHRYHLSRFHIYALYLFISFYQFNQTIFS